MLLGAKARALLEGRVHVSCGDIRAVAPAILRHRVLTNFNAEADGIRSDDIVKQLLETIPAEASTAMDAAMAGRVFTAERQND